MQKLPRIFLLLCLFAPLFSRAAEPVVFTVDTRSTQMVVGTDGLNQLRFFHYGQPLGDAAPFASYKSLRRASYNTDPLAYPTSGGRYFNEAALTVRYADGYMNTELRYDSASTRAVDGNVSRTEILLRDVKRPLEVKLVYEAYRAEDVILSHAEITNLDKKPVMLVNYASSALPVTAGKYLLTHFHGSWAREMQVDRELLTHGIKTIETRKGVRTTHTENPSFMLSLDTECFDERHGEVIAGALAWTGNYRLSFQMDETGSVNVLSGINPYASEYPLGKGETFVTPDMIYTFSASGAGQASRNLHDWARNYGLYDGHSVNPTLLNSWEGAYFKFNTQTLTGMIDDAAAMGLELFVLDDGWFGGTRYPRDNDRQGLGDWEVIPSKLPEGIDYLAQYAHKKGIRFGIWIEPEMVNEKSVLAQTHPDWVVGEPERERLKQRGQWLLDLSNPKVQDFVFGVFDRTMQLSPAIDYIKWDANRHVENFGSDYLGEGQNRFFVEYVQGYYKVLERIRKKYPSVIIQACSSGGGRVDYGALRYHNEVWTSDNSEALSRVKIQYGTSLIYPACVMGSHVSAVPNHQTRNVTPLKFRFDIASAGRLGMELQPKDLNEQEKERCKAYIQAYKGFRDLVFAGDLYRLNSPYDEDGIYALSYVSKDRSRAVVFMYTTVYQGRTLSPYVRLDGLDPARRYKVTESCREKDPWWGEGGSFTGAWLMHAGLNPAMAPLYQSRVFLLEAE